MRLQKRTNSVAFLWAMLLIFGGSQFGCVGGFQTQGEGLNPETALATGEKLFKEGELEEAKAVLSSVLEENPDHPKLLNARGYVYAEQQNWAMAIEDFQQAIKVNPQNPQYLENLGVTYLRAGYPQKALPYLSRSLELAPDSSQRWNHRGLALSRLGQYREAIQDYSQALAFDHHNAEIYLNRGVALVKLERRIEAKTDLGRAIQLDPTLRQAYESRGLLALMEGEMQLAIQDFSSAMHHGSDGGLVHYNQAVALAMVGESAQAAKEFALACERDIFQACRQSVERTPIHQFL